MAERNVKCSGFLGNLFQK